MKKQIKAAVSIIIAISFIFGLSSSVSAAKKVSKGEKLYVKLLCASCHGKDGKGILCRRTKKHRKTGKIKCVKGEPKPAFAIYPKLAGQNKTYAYNQMKDILTGKRTNSQARAMYDTIVKAGLLEKYDIKNKDLKKIAKYLSKVK